MKISVIIVNYQVARFTRQAVQALLAQEGDVALEVFVVDNASADNSLAYLRTHFPAAAFPQIHIIDAGSNLGFSRANNLAAQQATGDYILFLNPDTIPAENLLVQLLEFAELHTDAGAVGVSMTNDDGTFAPESRRGLPTPWTAFCKMAGLTAVFPTSRLFGRYYMAYMPSDRPHATEVVSGACMMVRNDGRKAWFDTDYFMYGEDIDLSYRLMQEGKTNYYVPALLIHFKGESTNKTSYRYAHVFYGAMLVFLRKHFPHYAFWLRPIIYAAIAAKALKGWLNGLCVSLNYRFKRHKVWLQPRAAYFGSHGERFQKCADDLAWRTTIHRVNAEGHTTEDVAQYDFVVYDIADYTRCAIIRLLQQSAGKVRLALYDNATGEIIFHGAENGRKLQHQ